MRAHSTALNLFYLRPQIRWLLALVCVGFISAFGAEPFLKVERSILRSLKSPATSEVPSVQIAFDSHISVPSPGRKVALAYRGLDGTAGILIDEAVVLESAAGQIKIQAPSRKLAYLALRPERARLMVFELVPGETNPFADKILVTESR